MGGQNLCAPVRGPCPDAGGRGWWGETPPYHVPVFVLTNHARKPITMKGGTVFHFVTGGMKDGDRKSTRLNSSHDQISYAVFCLKKKKTRRNRQDGRSRRARFLRRAPDSG